MTAADALTLPELQDLRRTSAVRGAWLVLHAWVTIAGAMVACAIWPSALTLMLAIIVIGSRQLGLLVLMHEASHWLLVPACGPTACITGARSSPTIPTSHWSPRSR